MRPLRLWWRPKPRPGPYYQRSSVPELEQEATEAADRVLGEQAELAPRSLAEGLARAGHDTSPFPKEEAGLSWVDDANLLCAAAWAVD